MIQTPMWPRGSTLDFSTRAIHPVRGEEEYHGALAPPLFLSSTYRFPSAAEGAARFSGASDSYLYSRVGNPTVSLFEEQIASLEGGECALATASGMAAVAAVLWSQLTQGDHVLADRTLYGCTYALLAERLPKFGVGATFVDMWDSDQVSAAFTPHTRIAICETPANPTMRIIDIARLAEECRKRDVMLVVDNTYATPYLQRPLEWGADAVIHSATKYIGGHADLLGGVLVSSRPVVERARSAGVKEMTGGAASPLDAYLALRGLKTLALRMDRHSETAEFIATKLATCSNVAQVYYPSLISTDQHSVAQRQMRRFGGMLAFEIKGGVRAAQSFLDSLRLVVRAISLGSAETLAQHPASMTHSNYDAESLVRAQIGDGLVRLSSGLEHPSDIWADIEQALRRAAVA